MSMISLIVVLILFVAALTRSTIGFGFGLLAMPLLTLTLDVKTAVPLVGFVSITIGAVILWGSWRDVEIRTSWHLLIAALLGVPVGIWALNMLPATVIKGTLGVTLILLGCYNLFRPLQFSVSNPRWGYFFGFMAGILGAYNIAGPPMVVYSTLRRWSPAQFRATMQGFLFPTILFAVIGHGVGGLWTSLVFRLYLIGLPGVLLSIYLGSRLNHLFNPKRFERALYFCWIILGIMLMV